MFERGDFVRVKPETILDTGEIAENWGGEIFHVDEENGLYGMGVDLSSEEAIEAYLMKKQMTAFAQQPREPRYPTPPEDPFKKRFRAKLWGWAGAFMRT
ncbi:hypothetical protein [Phaeodactylibacter xiamenensis]|uniref:hypothetical protein n=1 Tax=Phaeodactylibacter xiamenensis TaxID=1524460 RepID=UPI0024A8DB33|nr:hypothetical protein [Phaeodactylibacter xiamenensis]